MELRAINEGQVMKEAKIVGWYMFFALVFVGLVALAFMAGRWVAHSGDMGETETVDTVIVKDTVRIPIEKLQTQIVTQEVVRYVYRPVVVTDTFVEHDTIIQVNDGTAMIPISRKEYTDNKTYRAVVTGYDPKLEEMEVYRENLVVTVREKKKQRLGVGVQAGVGYGFFNSKPDLYVGLGASYNLWP